MNLGSWASGKPILEDIRDLNIELAKERYDDASKAEIERILLKYEFDNRYKKSRPFDVVQTRKKLFSRPNSGGIKIKASGRKSWVGWVELQRELYSSTEIENSARVLAEIDADVVCLIEVENRIALHDFNKTILSKFMDSYPHNMLIDGNDPRGIDVCILSRFPIHSIRSHIDDQAKDENGAPLFYSNGEPVLIFSRDCPEYRVDLPSGAPLYLLPNHLKSQGYGTQASNDARREAQATQIKEILNKYDLDQDLVVVAGDLNDIPANAPLQPLMGIENLHDVLDKLETGSDRWTYAPGRLQFDYLLVSSKLVASIDEAGIERQGLFSRDSFGGRYPHFPTVKGKTSQASDHAAVWTEFSL
jgi:endonuclease/exonuclease/phosphatase family metal-dependent hydrolase